MCIFWMWAVSTPPHDYITLVFLSAGGAMGAEELPGGPVPICASRQHVRPRALLPHPMATHARHPDWAGSHYSLHQHALLEASPHVRKSHSITLVSSLSFVPPFFSIIMIIVTSLGATCIHQNMYFKVLSVSVVVLFIRVLMCSQ